MNQLTFIQNHQTFLLPYEKEDTVLRVLQKNGMFLRASCGGRGTCGHCLVLADGVLQKACKLLASSVKTVELPTDSLHPEVEVLSPTTDTNQNTTSFYDHYGIAVDIGTTTIAFALVNLTTGKILSSCGFQNPGSIYGADILSRLEVSNRGLAVELQDSLRSALSQEILSLIQSYPIPLKQLAKICITANTAMCHLLLGLSCKELGRAPFRPVMLDYPSSPADLFFGKEFLSSTEVTIIPGLSAFLGGDISSGLFSLNFPPTDSYSLFIDMGTNGEMVLGNASHLFGTSVAAGPAFEGSLVPGSTVLSALNEMLQKKGIDQTGLLQGIFFHMGYQYAGHTFSQEDIRNIQLAKASLRGGIEALLDAAGILADSVSTIYLCGGFGTHTDSTQAIALGLFPKAFSGKIHCMGNTALAGAVKFLLHSDLWKNYFNDIKTKLTVLDLSSSEIYKEHYLKWMNFP